MPGPTLLPEEQDAELFLRELGLEVTPGSDLDLENPGVHC